MPDYRLFETANPGKAQHNVELLDTFRLACADNLIFLKLAFSYDLQVMRRLLSEYGA